MEEVEAPGKKKRKKKKKKIKVAGEDVEAESEALKIYQEPPKFEVNGSKLSYKTECIETHFECKCF